MVRNGGPTFFPNDVVITCFCVGLERASQVAREISRTPHSMCVCVSCFYTFLLLDVIFLQQEQRGRGGFAPACFSRWR